MAITWVDKHALNGEKHTVTLIEVDDSLPLDNIVLGVAQATGNTYSVTMHKDCLPEKFMSLLKDKILLDREKRSIAETTAAKFDFSGFEGLLKGAK